MRRALAAVMITFCAGVAIVSADTLILLDGSRIEGRVLAVRDDVVEFEERGSRRRIVRHRDEVARIEFNNGRPIPASPAAALNGRVGDETRDLFFIGGEQGPFRMRAGGTLYLGVNDDTFNDNSGAFRVVIHY